MIRISRPALAMSYQDLGRIGQGSKGHCRSGAMDPASLEATNKLAGARPGSAAIEMGPGPCSLEVMSAVTIAFGGADREGAPWWTTMEVKEGDRLDLSSSTAGVWSYLSMNGGMDSPVVLGSRSTCTRESIGRWIRAGDVVGAGSEAMDPLEADPLPMIGDIRIFGDLPTRIQIGSRTDRMGYQIVGSFGRGASEELSEPMMPGFVQVLPSGDAFVLMAEAPTVGGYPIQGVIHGEDLRFVAQAQQGNWIHTARN